MKCMVCGAEAPAGDRFCMSCGAALAVNDPPVVNNPPVGNMQQPAMPGMPASQYAPLPNYNHGQNGKKLPVIIIAIVAVILVIALCAAAVFAGIYISRKNKAGESNDLSPTVDSAAVTEQNEQPGNMNDGIEGAVDGENPFTTENKTTNTAGTAGEQSVSFDQYELNILLSNLTEVGMGSFSGVPDINAITLFASMHSLLNYNPAVSGIEYGEYHINGNYYNTRIRVSYISQLAKRFFDADISESSFYSSSLSYHFYNGYYYSLETGGECSQGVAVVRDLTYNKNNNTYTADFSIYTVDYRLGDSEAYSYTSSQAENSEYLTRTGNGYAILQPHTYNGSKTYKVIDYHIY